MRIAFSAVDIKHWLISASFFAAAADYPGPEQMAGGFPSVKLHLLLILLRTGVRRNSL